MLPRLAAAALLAAPALAQEVPEGFAMRYLCDGGAVLQVAYLNPAEGPSLAVVDWQGRLVPMEAGPTGSGVRYVAYAGGLIWHGKGLEGVLLQSEGSDETVVLGGCREAG